MVTRRLLLPLLGIGCAHFDAEAGKPFMGTYSYLATSGVENTSVARARLELLADGTFVEVHFDRQPDHVGRASTVGRWWTDADGVVLRPRGGGRYRAWLVQHDGAVYLVDIYDVRRWCSTGGPLNASDPRWRLVLRREEGAAEGVSIPGAELCGRAAQ